MDFDLPVNNTREAIIDNIKINLKGGYAPLTQHEWRGVPLAVVAGGPSLKTYLSLIKQMDCPVLAVNGAYKFLMENGVIPAYFLLIDSRYDNIVHLENPHITTTYCLASQVHPAVFEKIKWAKIKIFHLGTDSAKEALGDQRYTFLTAPIGMASVHAVYVGAALGYKEQFLFGYDFSQSSTKYAFDQPMNDVDEVIEVTVGDEKFRTTIALAKTAENFVEAISPVINACGLDIRLCSEGLLSKLLTSNAG